MLPYLLAACALACPLVMAVMMWRMRGHRGSRHDD
jgi:hypothetical protein